jgi:hypothetical protein
MYLVEYKKASRVFEKSDTLKMLKMFKISNKNLCGAI